jgi:hypothetical protein
MRFNINDFYLDGIVRFSFNGRNGAVTAPKKLVDRLTWLPDVTKYFKWLL